MWKPFIAQRAHVRTHTWNPPYWNSIGLPHLGCLCRPRRRPPPPTQFPFRRREFECRVSRSFPRSNTIHTTTTPQLENSQITGPIIVVSWNRYRSSFFSINREKSVFLSENRSFKYRNACSRFVKWIWIFFFNYNCFVLEISLKKGSFPSLRKFESNYIFFF